MSWRAVRRRSVAAFSVAALMGPLLLVSTASAESPRPPVVEGDYCGDQCHEVMPPGQNGNATLAEIASHTLFGTHPKHSDDQIDRYDALATGYPDLTTDTIQNFFNDNSFGVAPEDVERTYQPRQDVTVVRDKTAGVPHVYGSTRSGTTFGAGYTTAEDKLFLMDVLRRAGRGQVTPFAGGAESNRSLEQSYFATSPYTEQELQQQIDVVQWAGPRGKQALADAKSYVAGINSYIEQAHKGRYFPGEYVATGHIDPVTNEGQIEPFKLTDLVVLGALVGAQFGGGGGGEVQQAVARMSLHERFGPQRGEQIFHAFRAENDPEAVSTIHDGRSFPYGQSPENPKGVALPDPGSVTEQQLVFDESGSAAESNTAENPSNTADPEASPKQSKEKPGEIDTQQARDAVRGIFNDGVVPSGMGSKDAMSNALMVSGEHTESGNPVAVFGPQVGYFAPQLLTLQELQGPGISSKGASFAGLSFYTLLGRGQDYAWSATTAAQDIIDTYAVELCEPDGGPVTRKSNSYLFRGECLPMKIVERENSWQPSLGDNTPEGSYRLASFRTKYGPVTHRATMDGKPVAYTTARSTFMHEVDSIVGFQKFNDPDAITSAESFQRAAQDVNYTFNWFYADAEDTAYFNSGDNLVRKPDVDPSMPIVSDPAFEWKDWNPDNNRAAYTSFEQHPNSINQDYYTNWNNKQAPGTSGAGAGKGAVQRGDLLDSRVQELVADSKVTRASLTKAMAEAGLTDLRAERVLPDLLRVLESSPIENPKTAELVASLKSWLADGGIRTETEQGSHQYAHAETIELMDAWWPLLVQGQFEPVVGPKAYQAMTEVMEINRSPSGWQNGDEVPEMQAGESHQGSAFLPGWYAQVSKDIRAVLGEKVPGGFGKPLCGDGDLGACRQMLLDTLEQAAAAPPEETYPGDAQCEPGDQWCADSLVHGKLGGIGQKQITWQNRPTYQQVVEFPTKRP